LAAVEKRAEKGVSEAVLQAKVQVKREEQEMCERWLKHDKQGGGTSHEDRLYATMMTGCTGGTGSSPSSYKHAAAAAAIEDGRGDIIDSSVLEAFFSDLSGPDSRALMAYIEKKRGDLDNKMREALRPLLRNVGDRPLFAHPVVTVLVQEVKQKKKKKGGEKKDDGDGDASPPHTEQQQEQQLEVALITISRPSEELMDSLREGGVYSVTWLSPDSSSGGGYSPGGDGDGAGGRLATWTHLSTNSGGGGGKMSMWRPMKKKVEDLLLSSSSLLQWEFTPRQKLDLATMLNMEMVTEQPNDDNNNNGNSMLKVKLFDYSGMLVHVGPKYPDPNCPGHFMQWLFLTDTSLLGVDDNDEGNGWMLAVKLQGPDDAIDWLGDGNNSSGMMRGVLKDLVLGGVDEENKLRRAYGDQLSGVVVSRLGKEGGRGWMDRMEVMRGKAAALVESKN
jgi:hypothetical protein